MQVTDVSYEVKEGDARNVLCEAVERHHADMLVMGSHGYGAFKRFVSCYIFPNLYSVFSRHAN
jgi:nucleotide-binding universal stress UspA family protein